MAQQIDTSDFNDFVKTGALKQNDTNKIDTSDFNDFVSSQMSFGEKTGEFGKGFAKQGVKSAGEFANIVSAGQKLLNPLEGALKGAFSLASQKLSGQEMNVKKAFLPEIDMQRQLQEIKPENKYQELGATTETIAEYLLPARAMQKTATGLTGKLVGGATQKLIDKGSTKLAGAITKGTNVATNVGLDTAFDLAMQGKSGQFSEEQFKQNLGTGIGYNIAEQGLGSISPTAGRFKKVAGAILGEGTKAIGAGLGAEATGGDFGTVAGTSFGLGTALRGIGGIGDIKNQQVRRQLSDEANKIINIDTTQPIQQPKETLDKAVGIYNNAKTINETAVKETRSNIDSKLQNVIAKSIKPLQKEFGVQIKSQKQFNDDMSSVLMRLSKDSDFINTLDDANAVQTVANKLPELKNETYAKISSKIDEAGNISKATMSKTFNDIDNTIIDMSQSRRYGDPDMIQSLQEETNRIKQAIKFDQYGDTMSFKDYQENLQRINQEVSNAYLKMKAMQPLTMRDKALIMIRNFLADDLDEQVEAVLGKGQGLKDIKAEYSAIKNVEKAINKRAVQLNRANKDTLAEQIAGYMSLGDAVFNPVQFAIRKGTAGLMNYYKKRNDPNYIMRDFLTSSNQLLKSNGYIDDVKLDSKIQELQNLTQSQQAEKILSTIDEVKTIKQQREQAEATKPLSEDDIIRNEARQKLIQQETLKRAETKRKQIEFEEERIKEYAEKNNLDYLKDEDYTKAKEGYLKQQEEGKIKMLDREAKEKAIEEAKEKARQEAKPLMEVLNNEPPRPKTIYTEDQIAKTLEEMDGDMLDYVMQNNEKAANGFLKAKTPEEASDYFAKLVEDYGYLHSTALKQAESEAIGDIRPDVVKEFDENLSGTAKTLLKNLIGETKNSTKGAGDIDSVKNMLAKSKANANTKKEIEDFLLSVEENKATDGNRYADDVYNELVDYIGKGKSTKMSANPYALTGVGALYGFEKDENGKWRFNPEKAMQGMAMGTVAGAGARAMSKKGYNSSRLGMFGGESVDEFQKRVIAGQELGDEIGKKVNSDGTITLYHGTSKQNADKIMKGGSFNDGTYFSVKKGGTEFGDSPLDVAKRKFGKNATVLEIKVDARGLESAAAGSEVFSPKELIKDKDGIWKVKTEFAPKSPLHEEARKYKTKEEFVKGQGAPVYHGTNNDIKQFLPKKGTEKEAGNVGTYFTSSKNEAGGFGKNVVEAILPPDAKTKKIYQDVRTERDIADEIFKAKNDGYDAIIIEGRPVQRGVGFDTKAKRAELSEAKNALKKVENDFFDDKITEKQYLESKEYTNFQKIQRELNPTHTIVFNPDKLKTKSQLEQIWEEANKN